MRDSFVILLLFVIEWKNKQNPLDEGSTQV
jgi:hypothetical protein